MGIPFDNLKIFILRFADDIIIHAENESPLQKLLDFVNTLCNNCKIRIRSSQRINTEIKLKSYISEKYMQLV